MAGTLPYEDLLAYSSPAESAAVLQLRSFANALPFPSDVPESFDKVLLAGVELPGIAKVEGEITQKLDQKKKPGSNGARITLLGWEPAKIDITLSLWTPEHWSAMVLLATRLRPRSSKSTPDPSDIFHPSLAMYGIKSVLVYSLGLARQVDEQGFYEVKLKALEFRSDDAKTSTPKASVVDYGGNEISPQLPVSDVPPPSANNTGPT